MSQTDLKMVKKLIIVADDFTGANDTGVQFRNSGLKVNVVINSSNLQEEAAQCDVLVVDLESRMDTVDVAYRKSINLGKQILALGNTQVYKKLDSAFRGNVGTEIDGLMKGLNINVAFLAPAYPKCGRTTEDGNVIINGIKLADTEYRNDPNNPVKDSRITDIIGNQSKRVCDELPSGFAAGAPEKFYFDLEKRIKNGSEIFIFDCLSEIESGNIAKMIEGFHDGPFIVAGSAGLASHLNYHTLTNQPTVCFVFSGSITEISLKQIDFTESEGNCTVILLDAINLIDDKVCYDDIAARVNNSINKGINRFIFSTARSRNDVDSVIKIAKQRSIPMSEVAQKIALSMGRIAAAMIDRFNPRGVLVTGGETAYRTVDALNATGLTIETEILPGMQCGKLRGYRKDTLFATKSGGFGGPDAISKSFEFFKI